MGIWSDLHLYTLVPTLIVLAALAALIAHLLNGKSELARRLPFIIVASIVILLEIGKQINEFSDGNYDLYSLPFHYCSIFLFTLPLHAFYRGKYKRVVDIINFATGSSLFFFMIIMPAIVYGDGAIKGFFDSYGNFHTVTFHAIVCFYFFLTVLIEMPKTETGYDLKVMGVFLTAYVALATLLSHLLKTNFHNLYHCNLGMIEEIRLAMVESIGWLGQAIYTVVLYVLTILFAYAGYFFVKLVLNLFGKIKISLKAKA